MIIISPKILASNFIAFLYKRLISGIGWNVNYLLKAILFLTFLTMIPLKIGKYSNHFDSFEKLLLYSFLISFMFVFFLFLTSQIIVYFFEWPYEYKYCLDKVIVKNKFSDQEYKYSEIDRIILQSKFSAQLLFKISDSYTLKVSRWYGNSKEDWINFINYLKKNNVDSSAKLFVQYFQGVGLVEKKMNSAIEAYNYFEDRY